MFPNLVARYDGMRCVYDFQIYVRIIKLEYHIGVNLCCAGRFSKKKEKKKARASVFHGWKNLGTRVVSAKRRGRLAINRDALFMRVVRVLLRERRREKVAQLLDTRTAIISEQGYIKRNENINCHVLDSFVNFFSLTLGFIDLKLRCLRIFYNFKIK